MNMLLIVVSLAVLAAYVCRFDPLSWRRTPGLMLAHLVGAVPALWATAAASIDDVRAVHLAALAASVVLLIVLYPRMPKAQWAPTEPAPVSAEALERVRGGSKPPEQLP